MLRARSGTVAVVTVAMVAVACSGSDDRSTSRAPSHAAAHVVEGRVDVGGYQLAYRCLGTGSPTIVTEAGYDSSGLEAFRYLLGPWSSISRVCAYDRAGIGLSDQRPDAEELTSGDEADELHRLLQGAGIEPPYVVMAHSYGGFVSRLFAATYRDQTTGLVLVESSHEDEIQAYRDVYGQHSPDADWVDGGDLLDIDATGKALRTKAHDLGDLPVVVIRAERYEDVLSERLWRRTQADLATISDDGVLAVARGSGHFVVDQAPAVVTAALEAAGTAARAGTQLPPCEQIFAGVDANCPS